MTPDDPRHGTEAGHEQHHRDGEPPCGACTHGDLIASRRRAKRRNLGHEFTRPLGTRLHTKLVTLRDQGARLTDIAQWAGVSSDSIVWRAIEGGPSQRMYAKNWIAFHNMIPGRILTREGAERRLQALGWLGWSITAIAAASGVNDDTLRKIRAGEDSRYTTRETIAHTYDQLHMTTPPTNTVGERRGVGRTLAHARQNNWAPPAAWDQIDDPDATPQGVEQPPSTRLDPTRLDPSIVERILAGEWRLDCSKTEKSEVARRFITAGGSSYQLRQLTRWKVERYYRIGDAA